MSYDFKYKLDELDNLYVNACKQSCYLEELLDIAYSALINPLSCRVDTRPGETNNGYAIRKIDEYRKGLEND